MDLFQQVLRQLRDVVEVRHRHVLRGNCDDLVILLVLVQHVHHSDHLGFHQAQRLHLGAADHQDVQRVMVLAVGARDETVVLRVVDRAEQNSVQLEQPTVLVELVLDLALRRDLDDGVDDRWGFFSVGHAVPWIIDEEFLVLTHGFVGELTIYGELSTNTHVFLLKRCAK